MKTPTRTLTIEDFNPQGRLNHASSASLIRLNGVWLKQSRISCRRPGAGNLILYKGVQRLSSGQWQCGNVQKVLNSRNTREWLWTKMAA